MGWSDGPVPESRAAPLKKAPAQLDLSEAVTPWSIVFLYDELVLHFDHSLHKRASW